MIRVATAVLASLLSISTVATPVEGPRVGVVMISLDGLMPRYVAEADTLGLDLPNIRRLVENGVMAEGVTGVLPSVTYPSHTTLITGVPPSRHGIESNHVLDPEDRGQDPWYWFAEDIRVPTLVHAAEVRGLVTGSVSWPATIGLPADHLVPEFWRGWSSHPFDRRLLDHLSSPGLLDAVGRHRNRPVPGFSQMTDRDRTDIAKWMITTAEPDLLLVHLFDLDFAQHDHGPSSPEAFAALEANDAMIGEILDTLEAAGVFESTVIFIVSDHGFFDTHSDIAPNTLLVEEGLIRLGEDNRTRDWDAYFLSDAGSAALVLKNAGDRKLLARIEAVVSRKAEQPGSGIYRVLDAADTAAMGSNAPLVIDVANGFEASGRVTGPWSEPSRKKGAHGHAPDRPEALASLIISGGPLASRGTIGTVQMTRIAPTVAWLMNLRLSDDADEPLPLAIQDSAEE